MDINFPFSSHVVAARLTLYTLIPASRCSSLRTHPRNPATMPNPIDAFQIGQLRATGAFNGGIEVWQKNDSTGTRLVKKIFRHEDVPDHAEHEIAVLERLKGCPYVTRMHGHKVNRVSKSAYVYLECCSKGSLWDMIDLHREHDRRIPESFAWHIFWCLANAVAYLQHGPDDDSSSSFSESSSSADWSWIFHRDIHPGNVFITGGERIGDHIHVLLGDFGSSITEDRDDNMEIHMQMQAFRVPERRMNHGSDVFQLGLVMIAVCRLTRNPHNILHFHRRGALRGLAGSKYSSRLNRLIKECCRTDPARRIEIRELVREIDRAGVRNPHMRDRLRFPELEIIGQRGRLGCY